MLRPSRARQPLITKYTTGRCSYLAAALHYEYRLPIEMALYRENANDNNPDLKPIEGEEPWLNYHCWVILPNRWRLDIKGAQSYKDITRPILSQCNHNEWSVRIQPATLDDLQWYSADQELTLDEAYVQEALDDARDCGILQMAERVIARHERRQRARSNRPTVPSAQFQMAL
jgi:hypothetical protein